MGEAAEIREVEIPYKFTPRVYQVPPMQAIREGIKRLFLCWHRRCGKDKTCLNICIDQMVERVGAYYYFFPTYAQGKKAIWKGIDKDGFKLLDHFPPEIVAKKNVSDLSIELTNGSFFQIVGADNYDSIVGGNPVGCVFSEFALTDPRSWDFIRPILKENDGWAIFNTTPRGPNHAKVLFDMAEGNDKWFASILTVDDTVRDDGKPILTEADIQEERDEGMSEELIQQEYYCSFEGCIEGAYFAKQMRAAKKNDRIMSVPYDERLVVDTYWDLGMDDSMTIWFMQQVGRELRMIDYLEASGEGFSYYAKELKDKDYNYGMHYLPHDAHVRELTGAGVTRKKAAEDVGIKPITVVPRVKQKEMAIRAARGIFSQVVFDEVKCKRGINALKNYHKKYDEKEKVFKNTPAHNWASHGADAFMTFAQGFKQKMEELSSGDELPGTDDDWMGA